VQVALGTFNLNNLFSRFDFRADVSTASASSVKVEERTSFSFTEPSGFKLRTYLGKLVKGKLAAERADRCAHQADGSRPARCAGGRGHRHAAPVCS
jgi:hypothetical protein